MTITKQNPNLSFSTHPTGYHGEVFWGLFSAGHACSCVWEPAGNGTSSAFPSRHRLTTAAGLWIALLSSGKSCHTRTPVYDLCRNCFRCMRPVWRLDRSLPGLLCSYAEHILQMAT